MAEIVDQEFIQLFEQNITFENKDEEVKYWKGVALDCHQKYKAQEDQYNEFRMFSEQLENELELSLKAAEDKIANLEPKSYVLEDECKRLKENLFKIRSQDSESIAKLQEDLQSSSDQNSIYKTDLTYLQIENDKLERNTKIIMSSLTDIESKFNETIETNFYLQQELSEKDCTSKKEMQRMMDELRDLRTEMAARDKKRAAAPYLSVTPPISNFTPQSVSSHPGSVLHSRPLGAQAAINTPSPLPEGNRLHALSILGDILRKVGSVESRLASCKTNLSKDLRRPRPSSPTPVPSVKRAHVQVDNDFLQAQTEVAV